MPANSPGSSELPFLPQYRQELGDFAKDLPSWHSKSDLLEAAAQNHRQSIAYYAALFKNAPVGFLVVDSLGDVCDLNETLRAMLELNKPGARLQAFFPFLARNCVEQFLDHLRQSWHAQSPVTCELTLRTATGRFVPVELITYPASQSLFHTVVIDISKHRNVEESLAKTRTDFQAMLDTVPGVVWEADANLMQLSYVSRSAELLLGYGLKYWEKPEFWLSCIHVDDRERVANLKARAINQHGDLVLEYRMVRADRRTIWVRDTMTVRELRGSSRLYGVAIDITDRKIAEQELQDARHELERKVIERTAELRGTVADLEAFSYSLSHDLRAPLRAMQGYSQLLMKLFASRLNADGRDYLNRIMTSAERLDHLIQDVLSFSKLARAPLELKPIDLESLLNGIIQDNPTLRPPHAEIEIQKPLLAVLGNEASVTQCMTNLLSNAVKFRHPNKPPRVFVSTRSRGTHVQLWVEDNGIGIAPEDQARIFGIFQRVNSPRQYEGTGIGLAIVKKAAERMGGSIGVESVPGEGSKFWLQLQKAEL